MALSSAEREYFDEMVEEVVAELPEMARRVFDDTPLVIEDYPPKWLLRELGVKKREELCGLHDGVAHDRRSISDGTQLPDQITIYRLGVMTVAKDDQGRIDPGELFEQIRITLLHEVGHHFGMTEEEIDELGYG